MRSEYTLKYQYVAPQTAVDGLVSNDLVTHLLSFTFSSHQSRPAAKAPPPSSSAHLLGLDGGGVSSGGPGDNWQSEYEERFTALRQQQRALLRGAQQDEGEGHVAGVASERHDAYPVNYAWKEAPQVVVSSVSTSHFNSYNELLSNLLSLPADLWPLKLVAPSTRRDSRIADPQRVVRKGAQRRVARD